MSKHEDDDVENAERGTKSIRVKLDDLSMKEMQLCLQFSTPKGASEGSLKSANEDMQRLSLEEANKGSSSRLCEDADESVSRTILGLNRPSFQPSRRLGDSLVFKYSGKGANLCQRFAVNSYESEDNDDEYITQITAEELEEDESENIEESEVYSSSVSNSILDFSGADSFDYVDEESAAEDEDIGDARMPSGAML
ncbi:hypothetical protein GGI43DRAFT_7933 [Trichoderma evansii]